MIWLSGEVGGRPPQTADPLNRVASWPMTRLFPGHDLGAGRHEMKFEIGDETDRQLVQGLQHEIMRCRRAYAEFSACAPALLAGRRERQLSYVAYNAYARYIHHLYEFLLGCGSRRRGDTHPLQAEAADELITTHLQRILTVRRQMILAGRTDARGNGLEAYPAVVPSGFATEFRRLRNTTIAHVTPKRAAADLSRFYRENNFLLFLMVEDASFAWGDREGDFPDLGAMTAFSILSGEGQTEVDEGASMTPTDRD